MRSPAFLPLSVVLLLSFAAHSSPSTGPTKCVYDKEAIEIPGDIPINQIALTFDDGPNPQTTPKVLALLKKYNIKATFFLIGTEAATYPKLVQRILDDGHIIGNHTYSHPHLPLLTKKQIRDEFQATDKLLQNYVIPYPRLIRFPYGESSCTAEKIAKKMHYNIVGWHVDSCDWSFADGLKDGECIADPTLRDRFRDDYVGWIDYQFQRTHGGVVLMHDAIPFTAQHLESVLERLSQSYSFITLDSGAFSSMITDHTPWNHQ